MSPVVIRAHSFLFVPASRPERFTKAMDSGADCVILDLEDALPPAQKNQPRAMPVQGLKGFSFEKLAGIYAESKMARVPQIARLAVVTEVYAPSAADINGATRVLTEARNRKAETFSMDGRMVDVPVVLLAQKTLSLAGVAAWSTALA